MRVRCNPQGKALLTAGGAMPKALLSYKQQHLIFVAFSSLTDCDHTDPMTLLLSFVGADGEAPWEQVSTA